MSATSSGIFDAALALDGWVGSVAGALIGAVASVAVAAWVLSRTLRHEREQFAVQQRADRESFLEQAEHARALVIDQDRMHAFADFAGELLRALELLGPDQQSIEDALLPVVSAYHRWALYIADVDDEFVRGVDRGIGAIREKAQDAARAARAVSGGRRPSSRVAEIHFESADGASDIHWIVKNGRVWHLRPDERPMLAHAIIERFPRREGTDLRAGGDRMV